MKRISYIALSLSCLFGTVGCQDELDDELFQKYTYIIQNGWKECEVKIEDDNTGVLSVDFGVNGTSANNKDIVLTVTNDPDTLARFRALNPGLVLLPLCTIVGTLAGCAAASLLTPHSAAEGMAVGAGFGYYSLSSILITGSKGAALGTVALISNIIREIITLLCAPLLARWFGTLAPIAAGGATTADTTLPVIIRSSGNDMAVVSIYHGFVVDFSVPFLVTFLCSL